MKINPLTNARASFEKFQTSINGLLGQVPDVLKGPVEQLITETKTVLAALPADDAADTAPDLTPALNALGALLARLTETVASLTNSFAQFKEKAAADAAVLAGKVTDFEARLTNGQLVTQDQAKELAGAARQQGIESAKAEGKLLNDRKATLAAAGLPLPSDDALLLGEEAVFTARKDAAKSRVEILAGKGLALNGKAAPLVARAAWLPDQDTFDHEVKNIIEPILGVASSRTADPLLGAGAGGAATERRGVM